MREAGGEAMVMQADMSNPQDIDALFKATMDKWGTVDVLVNNAGETSTSVRRVAFTEACSSFHGRPDSAHNLHAVCVLGFQVAR